MSWAALPESKGLSTDAQDVAERARSRRGIPPAGGNPREPQRLDSVTNLGTYLHKDAAGPPWRGLWTRIVWLFVRRQ